jgi:sugar lactone lactonase YvrE
MLSSRFSGVRAFLFLVFLDILAVVPSLVGAQALILVQSGTRSAGSGSPGFNLDSAPATTVNLTPAYIVFDAAGNQYVSDTQNNCVRKIDTTGTISTIAGLAISSNGGDTCDISSNKTPAPSQGLYQPAGLAIDSSNNLYIADSRHNCIRKLANGATGLAALTTVAGTCGSGPSSTPSPSGLVIDSSNNLYIALQDTESTPSASTYQVLRQLPNASFCLMAGAPTPSTPALCPGIIANVTLNAPSSLALDAAGNLFIADTGNNCIREVASLTTQQTAVGQCTNDHTGNPATALNQPQGLAFSPAQSLFITESAAQNNNVVSYVSGSSTLTTVAGIPDGTAGIYNPTQDGTSALNAPLDIPLGIAVDSFGNLFVADSGNNIIRKLSSNLIFPATQVGSLSATLPITFLVNQNVNLSATIGTDFKITSNTCLGSLTATASNSSPVTCQVFISFTPTRPGIRETPLQLADSLSGATITQGLHATATGVLNVFTPGTVNTIASSLAAPAAVAVDSIGNAYVLQSGNTAGTASLILLPFGGGKPQTIIPAGKGLLTPTAIALDAAGNYYIADTTHGTVARFGADGSINTSYVTGLDTPTALTVDGFGNLYIAQAGSTHNVTEVYSSGLRRIVAGSGTTSAANGVAAATASFVSPSGLALDLNGILYIADTGAHLVYAIDRSGLIHQAAGNGTTTTTTAGQATGTALINPTSLSVDAAGDIYITDSAANIVYTVFAAGTNIATVLGTGTPGNTGDGGYAKLAQIDNPLSIAVDSDANLFVVDSANSSVREISYSSPTLAFGNVPVGQTSPVILQSLSNFGTDNVNLTSPFATSDSHFAVDPNSTTCGTTIIPGSTCTLGLTFSPSTSGLLTANSTLTSNSFNSPQAIQLSGTGKLTGPLQFILQAETEVYGQSFAQTIAITNSGPAPTGTITFSLGSRTLCTLNTTFASLTACNATASGLSVGNYNVTFAYSGDTIYPSATGSTTLVVTPSSLTVTVNSVTRTYGIANPIFTSTINGAFSGDTFSISYFTVATSTANVGTYAILPIVSGTAATNYAITTSKGTLTITPAPLTITALNATRTYGAANPTLFASRAGLLNDDTVNTTFVTPATANSPAGSYPIVPTAAGSNLFDYAVTSVNGTLKISQAATTVTVTASNSPATANTSVTFIAAVVSGSAVPSGIVNFTDGATSLGYATLNSNGVATLTTATLAIGAHTITASFVANANFTASASTLTQIVAAPTGAFTISVSAPSQFATGAGNAIYPITLNSTGGFAGQVALACSGLPANATCSFGSSPTLTAGGSATTTMTITTAVADARLHTSPQPTFNAANLAPLTAAAVFPFEFTGLGLFFVGLTRRKKLGTQKVRPLAIILFSLGILGLTGCGLPNTSFKTYTITVTGTSTSFSAPAQSTSVVLSVGN